VDETAVDPTSVEAAWPAHVLDDDERAAFERDGFLVVRRALDPAVTSRLRAVARALDLEFRAQSDVTRYHTLNRHDLIGLDDAFLELVDHPTTFPKVWGILGWHIQVFHTQLLVTPPAPAGATPGAYGWHQDNNRMNLDLETVPQPRVSVKVGYFLTDLTTPSMGNLCVVPGSHRRGRPDVALGEQPEGAEEILASAGDAILFDRRLWHSASSNLSSATRMFITIGYSYRWLRPKSTMRLDDLLPSLSPVRRQLLGSHTSANAWFDPTDEDVPLREWMRTHLGDAAVRD
jgi:ectoine hydroxylase-related dioxygenase (phytanoyl-CoA dioxygenase family)